MRHRHRLAQILSLILIASVVSQPSWPYGLDAHRAINDGAVSRSSLNDYLTDVLALEEGIAATFNDRDVRDWIRLGSAFEDNPRRRAANHFHYPLHPWDQALLTDFPGSLAAIESSVLWAQNPNQHPFLGKEDPWSWVNARRELFDALTLSDATERDVAFGNSFRALGQVLHLVADGSVPAHARNDSHVGGEPFETWLEAQAQTRLGERPEDARARFLSTFAPASVAFSPTVLGTTPNPLAPNPIAKVFDTDTYHGTEATLGLTTGDTVGITEFSNANFFSADTIFADSFIGNERFFPFPSRTNVEKLPDTTNNRQYWRKTGPGVPVDHLATVSRLDFFRQGGAPLTGGLDPVVHDEYARLLIPRAVGYSTGVIDYFFRGRLEAVDPEFTDTGVRLKVKNAIDAEETPEWARERLYAKDRQGKASEFVVTVSFKQADEERLIASDLVSLTVDEFIEPGKTSTETLSFTLPAPPADATDIEYRLIFRGRLGEEDDAVAVGLIAPASGFIVRPNYLPDDGISGNRLIVRSAGQWRLTEESNLQGGNIDWKGAYVNRRPTKVLSWSGPQARYFPDASGNPFSSNIYQNGERFARLPAVLGAAITKDAAGKEWLVAVSWGGNADIVYRRPNEKSNSFALFDPLTNPTGWQVIGRFPWEADFKPPNRPWFFNGKGNKAQTMRPVEDLEPNKPVWQRDPNKLDRLLIEIDIDSASATLTNLGNLGGITDTIAIESVLEGQAPRGLCDTRPTPNASGHEHGELRITRDFEGEYIVAVDYKDDTEVLGKIVAEGHDTYTAVVDKDWACKPVPFTLTHDTYVETFNHSGTESTDLIIGNSGKSVNIESLSHSGSGTLTHFPPIRDDTTGNSTSTLSRRTSFELLYLDLRNDLYAANYRDQASTGTGVVTGKQVCADRPSHSTETLRTSYTNEIVIDERTDNFANSSCNDGANFLPGRRPPFADFPFGTKTFYPTVRIGTAPGSWAVSANGDLFVSQEYRDRNFKRQYFNFLTNGDPEALIRTAPDNAWYFPVYVIK
ncbi:MAG: hypothetical protein ACE5H7_05280 [Acidiferrobacterales bacterium]